MYLGAIALPAYSIRLASLAAQAAGVHLLYTVPSGKIAVVRDIDLVTGLAVAGTAAIFAGSSGATFFTSSGAVALVWSEWRGRQVLPAGETLKVVVIGGQQYDVTVSGYLLTA